MHYLSVFLKQIFFPRKLKMTDIGFYKFHIQRHSTQLKDKINNIESVIKSVSQQQILCLKKKHLNQFISKW